MAEKILLEVEFDSARAEQRATQLRKTVADLATQRKQLNNAIKENQKEEARLTQAIEAQQSALKGLIASGKQNTQEYENAAKELRSLQSELGKVRDTQQDYFQQLNQTENAQKVARRELNLLNREAQAATGSLNQQRAQLAQLNRVYDQFRVGIDGTEKDLRDLERQIDGLTKEISEQEQATGRFQRKVGNYAGGIREAFASVIPNGQLLTGALTVPVGAINAAVGAIGAVSKALFDLQQRIEGQRKEVELLTGAIGNELDILTAKTAATSQTFGVDFNQTLQTTNAITRELGGTFAENSDAIAAGLAAAGSQGDELLEILKEYPSQFRDSEISAAQFVAIATQSIQEGVFSDKGVDAIKEAGLRLREMPKATKEALDGIGLSSQAIEEGLRNGTTTVFEEIQKVSARLDELPPQSAEVGKAVADIFGGAGEDAGLRYLTTLQNINTSLDETIAESGRFAQQQIELQQVNADLELSFNQLLGGADGFFTDATIGAKRLLANGLRGLIIGLEALINYFIDLYNESIVVRGAINAIWANIQTAIDVIQGAFFVVVNNFKALGRIIKAGLTGDFGAIRGIINETLAANAEDIKQQGSDIADNYVNAFNNTFRNKEVERFSFADAAAEKEAFEAGKRQAESFNEGVESVGSSGNNQASSQGIDTTALQAVQANVAELESLADTLDMLGTEVVEDFDRTAALLSLSYEKGLVTEEQYTRDLMALRIRRAQAELEQLEKGSTDYIAKQAEVQKLINEAKAQSEQDAEEEGPEPDGMTDLEALEEVTQAVSSFANDYVAEQDRMIEAEARRAVQAREGGNATEEQIQREIEARKAQSNSYQVAKAAQKAAAISEILIARAQQISQVQVAAAKIAATFPPPAGPILAGVYVAANVASAIADTRRRLAEVNALEQGGMTTGGERMQITHQGRIVKQKRSYKDGGVVRVPTMALTGEAGAEYVSPNHQIKRYPALFRWLDRDRNNPGIPMPAAAMPKIAYAFGGFTNYEIPAYVDGGLTARAAQSVVRQELNIDANLAFADAVANLPAPIVTVEDINAGQERKAQVDNSANI